MGKRMSNASKLLTRAASQIGRSGRPNPYTHWYAQRHGTEFLSAAWCDMFVSYIAAMSDLGKQVGEFAYCPSHINWFKKNKRWGSTPRYGAVVFFDWDNDGVADHVGYVEGTGSGVVYTIEGNTSDRVARRTRYPSDIIGYGYPDYGDPVPVSYPPLIKRGAKGANVVKAQKALIAKGYKLPKYGADGDFGSETESAVRRFQKARKLEVDGKIGNHTWKALLA